MSREKECTVCGYESQIDNICPICQSEMRVKKESCTHCITAQYKDIKSLDYIDRSDFNGKYSYMCESCGEFTILHQNFCDQCGSDKIKKYRTVMVCHKCEKAYFGKVKYCRKCGGILE